MYWLGACTITHVSNQGDDSVSDPWYTHAFREALVNPKMIFTVGPAIFKISAPVWAGRSCCGQPSKRVGAGKGSVEDDVCISPTYGAQAALVRRCVMHQHRDGRSQATAQSGAAHLEDFSGKAQATTRHGLATQFPLARAGIGCASHSRQTIESRQ